MKSIERLAFGRSPCFCRVPTSNRYETIFPREKRRRVRTRWRRRSHRLRSVSFSLSTRFSFIYVTCNDPRRITRMILFIRFVARIATRSRARNDIFSLPFVRAISFRLDRLVNGHAPRNVSHLFVVFRCTPRMQSFIYISVFSPIFIYLFWTRISASCYR